MTVAHDVIDLSFWQGPIDGWHFDFPSDKVPIKIQFICRCASLKETRFAVYVLNLRNKRYEYVGSSRKIQKIRISESVLTRPFYIERKGGLILQEWVPISSMKEGI